MRKWKGGLRCKERIWQLSIKGKREWAGVTGSEWLRDSGATAQSSGGILSVTMAGDWVGRGLRAWIATSQTKIWSSSPRATGGGESVRVVGSRQIALLNNTSSSLHGGLGHDEATLSSKDQRERATHPLYAAILQRPMVRHYRFLKGRTGTWSSTESQAQSWSMNTVIVVVAWLAYSRY